MSTQPLATRALSPETTNYLKQVTAPVKVPTMDDMLRDYDTFKSYVQLGAFESDMNAGDMIYEGGKQMVKDSWNWISSVPERFMANFGDTKERAQMAATQLQLYGNIGLNYEALGEGISRLGGKAILDDGSEEDLRDSYKFWKNVNEIEKRRATLAADMAADDSYLFGGGAMDKEVRDMIIKGEVKPDMESAMGGSIWADPINYVPFGVAFKAARGGSNVAFRGAEAALIRETQEMIALKAALGRQVRAGAGSSGKGSFGKLPTEQTTGRIRALDQMIAKNSDKITALANKRNVALDTVARQLAEGDPLKKTINDALKGIPVKGRTSIMAKGVGGATVIGGKTVENAGRMISFLQTLVPETAINIAIKAGVPEEKAVELFGKGMARKLLQGGTVGGGSYLLTDYLLDDELLALSASALSVGLPTIARYGRDLGIAGRQMMVAETTLPYFKRLSAQGSEKLTERIIDRDVLIPFKSTMEKVYGAAEGKVVQRAISPSGKLTPESQMVVDFLDTTKIGRVVEQGGRVAQAAASGGAVGGAFGFAASGGGEMKEAFYGGIGAGFTIGLGGGTLGSMGRLRGFRSPSEVTEARYGDYLYFKDNLLPEGQKEAFDKLSREVQMAYSTVQMSYPDLTINFVNKGKRGKSGFFDVRDDQGFIEVNVDSPRAIEPLLSHEITHFLDKVGGTLPFNDLMIGNALIDQPGIFTERVNGEPVKVGEPGNAENPVRYKQNKEFEKRRFEYGRKLGIPDKDIERVMTDERTVREIVAEHGVDFFLNDPRRYRDLHEGPIGALIRNMVEGPLLNNTPFLRNFIAKLGGTFRADGLVMSPNEVFSKMQRIPGVTELIRKYNRQIEGLSPDRRAKNFPIAEGREKVQVTGAELSKNPELVDLIRGGTILRVDENGNVVSDLAMTAREANKYNRDFSEAIKNEIDKKDGIDGLPEGHVREKQNAAGRTEVSGRYLDTTIIDAVEASGNWNKEQISILRKINQNLKDKGGNEFMLQYFKASSKKSGRKYVNAAVETLIEVPYGIEITQKGNIIVRTVSVDQLTKNVDKLIKQQSAEVTRLYGPDLETATTRILQDLDVYHRNHAEGKPGSTNLDANPQIADAKKNLINSAFGRGNKSQLDANPWLSQLGKKEPRPVYRSRRIERIGKVDQLSGQRFTDYDKVSKNFLPAVEEAIFPPYRARIAGKTETLSARDAMLRQDVTSVDFGGVQAPKRVLQNAPTSEATRSLISALKDPADYPGMNVAKVWKAISRSDKSFKYGKITKSKDIKQIAKAYNLDVQDFTQILKVTGFRTRYDGGMYISDPKKPNSLVQVSFIENPQGKPFLSVNAEFAGEDGRGGGFGSRAYQAVLDYAHNNGFTYRPSHSLTPINQLRTVTAMLSSALKHGTTKHMKIREEQGFHKNMVEIFGKDYDADIAILAGLESDLVYSRLKFENDEYRFDFDKGQFFKDGNTRDSGPIDAGRIDADIRRADPKYSEGVGAATAKRAIVTRSATEIKPTAERKRMGDGDLGETEAGNPRAFETGALDRILYLPPMSVAELRTLRNIIEDNTDGFTVSLKGQWADRGFVVAPEKSTEAFITPNKFNEKAVEDYIFKHEDMFDLDGSHLGGWYDTKNRRYVLDAVFPIENRDAAIKTALWGDQDAIFSLYDFKTIKTKDKNGRPIIPRGFGESARSVLASKPDSVTAYAQKSWRDFSTIREESSEGVLRRPEDDTGAARQPEATSPEGQIGEDLDLPAFDTANAAIKNGAHGSVVHKGIKIDQKLADQLNLPAASAAYFDPGFSSGSYIGKIAFPMMADRMKTGTYTSRSGKNFELRGGPDHPDLPINQGKVAWASMGGPQTTQLQNAINRTDGIGLVVLMDEMAVASNRTYARIMIEELKYDMANNPDAAAIMPEQIAEAAKAVRTWARNAPVPKKKFFDFKIETIADLEAIYEGLSFDVRKIIFSKIANQTYKKKGGLFWKDLARDLIDYKNDDGYRTGDIVKVIQFDQGDSIIDLASLGISPDPTYDTSFAGRSISDIKGRLSVYQVLKKPLNKIAKDEGKPGKGINRKNEVGPQSFITVMRRGLTEPRLSKRMKAGDLDPRNYKPIKFDSSSGPQRRQLQVREQKNLFMPALPDDLPPVNLDNPFFVRPSVNRPRVNPRASRAAAARDLLEEFRN